MRCIGIWTCSWPYRIWSRDQLQFISQSASKMIFYFLNKSYVLKCMLKNVSNIIQRMLNYVSNVIYFMYLCWLKKVVLTFSNTWMHAVICKVIGFMEYWIWILWAKCMLINVCVMHIILIRLMAISIQKQSSGH